MVLIPSNPILAIQIHSLSLIDGFDPIDKSSDSDTSIQMAHMYVICVLESTRSVMQEGEGSVSNDLKSKFSLLLNSSIT